MPLIKTDKERYMQQQSSEKRPALPEKWIVPIRLLIYLVIAGSSAYIYFNVRDLSYSHFFIFLPLAAVCAMALLDCRMSEAYWKEQKK